MAGLERPSLAGECIADRYQVSDVLGRGGMGTVYRVSDLRTGQSCALKRARANDGRKMRRSESLLEREYHTLAELAHPRIIEVYEYGVDEQGPYYTMELLEGTDLDKGGRLPWKQACAVLYDVASSLAILHARGLIHRDLSLRNVRYSPEGQAKLIDFGAMTAMGIAKDVVGTPPFVAPEALQLQELDARCDLFSLGAVGYYLLTGRNAYPARRLSELRDCWRSRPAPPARLVPELPPGLSDLIVQLLMLDRSARPRSAGEVMERLCSLSGLARDESIEVSRAYLTTPALVGRDQALVSARRELLSLVRRDGGTVMIEGVAGSGRSRMLSACVLEGKLLGLTVLQADAAEGARNDWSVARALCAQLRELMPNEALEAARLNRDVLAHVVDDLGVECVPGAIVPERSFLLRALRDFVLTLSQSQRLLVLVDDVDEIDEPSAALLAALAHKTDRHAVMLMLSMDSERAVETSGSLRLLRTVAKPIELEQLEPEETEKLLTSVFGDVPNVQLLAGRVHALAQGNPRTTMDLAQHLRERGLARYEAGSWLLPAQLDERDLPQTLTDALAGRLAALSADARALLEILCLAEDDAVAFEDDPELTGFGTHKRLFAALDELVAARVLIADKARYRFGGRGFLAVLRQGIPADRRRAIHGRLADHLGRADADVVRRADHLMRADRGREAIELLCRSDLQYQLPPVALLEQAVEQAEQLRLAARTIHQLRVALLGKATVVRAADCFRVALPKVLAQLERDAGLARHRELGEQLLPTARLEQALADTNARYLATPEAERVHSIEDAIRELVQLAGVVCSFSAQLFDLEQLESFPSLEPLAPLSPVLAVVGLIVEATKHWIAGRPLHHKRIVDRVLARIAEPDLGGFDPMQNERTRLGLGYGVALFEASFGVSQVERRVQELEAAREYRVNAWHLRMLLQLNQGNAAEARKCERRAELLQLQERSDQRYIGMGSGSEVMALAETGDLLGVKNCVEKLAVLAGRYPGWRPLLAYGQCRYRWLQGDLQGALDVLLPAFELALPARHKAFLSLAGAHVRLLAELGRTDEAMERGRAYLQIQEREQLLGFDHGISVGLAQVLAAAGEHEDAVRTIDAAIATAEKLGCAGLALGVLFETRALVAIRSNDDAAFQHFSDRCATEYGKARNPALASRFARVLEQARRRKLGEDRASLPVESLLSTPPAEASPNSVHSRILECVDESDRARCALTLLLQSTESSCGYLYGVQDGQAILLAALPAAPDADLESWVQQCLRAELGAGDAVTATAEDDENVPSAVAMRCVDSEGRFFEPIFLLALHPPPARISALLVLQMGAGRRARPPRHLLEELANELIEHGDVSGMQVEEPVTNA